MENERRRTAGDGVGGPAAEERRAQVPNAATVDALATYGDQARIRAGRAVSEREGQ